MKFVKKKLISKVMIVIVNYSKILIEKETIINYYNTLTIKNSVKDTTNLNTLDITQEILLDITQERYLGYYSRKIPWILLKKDTVVVQPMVKVIINSHLERY